MRLAVGTAVSVRGLASARAVADCVARSSLDAAVVALVVDDIDGQFDGDGDPLDVVRPLDLALEKDEFDRLTLLRDEAGLRDALAPWLLAYLLDRGADVALLLNADALTAPLEQIVELARDGVALWAGAGAGTIDGPAFSTDVVGVGAGAGAFLERWQGDFAPDGRECPSIGRWLERAPARFPIGIVRGGSDGAEAPEPAADVPYRFGRLPDGSELHARMRELYRHALIVAESGGPAPPPTPFGDAGADPFVAWLNEAVDPRTQPSVSRYLGQLWSDRADLRDIFPALVGETVERYLDWVLTHGADEGEVPACVRPAPAVVEERARARRRAQAPPSRRPEGVNVVGWLDALLGLGEVGRSLVAALRQDGVAVAPVNLASRLSARMEGVESAPVADANYDVNLLCVTAAETAAVADELGEDFFAGRRTIGLWFWEAEQFAIDRSEAFDLVDEVWTASEFTRDAVAAISPKPVRTVPVPLGATTRPEPLPTRDELGVPPGRFVFLSAWDFLSTPERKNPVGVVRAFTRAFSPDEGPVLVLKSINGDQRPTALAEVRDAAAGRSDVVVIDRYVSTDEQAALFAACDAYVSLHRSEGYGLTLAEAMALAKPVIATGYSGNLTFMDDSVAYLVRHELRPIGAGREPYPPRARWAEPDLDHAAALMRAVLDDPDEAGARARRGRDRVRRELSIERCGPVLAQRVAELRVTAAPPGTWRPYFMRGWRRHPHPGVVRRYEYDWLPDGTPVDDRVHTLLARGDGAPDPDTDGSEAFVAWLDTKVFPRGWAVVSRYLLELWRTGLGLSTRFPDLAADPAAFLRWVRDHGVEEWGVPPRLLPDDRTIARAAAIGPGGSGVGRAYRAARQAARTARPRARRLLGGGGR